MKTIFWNVDTQYDFMKSNGKLYVQKAEQIEGNLAKLSKLAEENGIVVVNTADWHTAESEELSANPNFIKTFPEHCMQNTKGAEFIPATSPENPYVIDWRQKELNREKILQTRNIVLYKDKFDIFTGTPHAEEVVRLLHPENAVVYGVATNVCVDYAVRGLLERKVRVYVPLGAIKELPNLSLPYEDWRRKGAILTSTDKILWELGRKK